MLIADIILLLSVATIGLIVGRVLRLSPIVGYLVAGVIAGPGGLAVVAGSQAIEELAEIGVALLLFGVGIEFSLEPLRRAILQMFASGTAQLALTIPLTAIIFRTLGMPWPTAVLIGFLISLSSTAIIFKLYSDEGEVDTPQGQATAGLLLYQDLALVPMMLLVPVLAGPVEGAFPAAARALVQASIAVGGLLVLTRAVLPRALALVARARAPELFPLVALLITFGTALAAASLGLSLPLGMFLAGLALSGSPYAHQVFAELLPLRDAFVAVFFTSVGMLFRPGVVVAEPALLLAMVAAVGLKGLLCGTVVLVFWRSSRLAVLAGLSLTQIGEFSFVLSREGTAAGLLTDTIGQAFIGAAVITMGATPFFFRAARLIARIGASAGGATTGLRDHVLVIGYGTTGHAVARVLREIGIPFVAVALDPELVRAGQREGIPVRFGDASRRAVLQALGAADARGAVVAVNNPVATRQIVSLLRQMNPGAKVLVRAQQVTELEELERLGADDVVPAEFETSIELFVRLLTRLGVPRNVVRIQESLIRLGHYRALRGGESSTHLLADARRLIRAGILETAEVMPGSPACDSTLADLDLRRRTGATVLNVVRDERPLPNPWGRTRLAAGDLLVLYGSHQAIDSALQLLEPAKPPS
jgi:CPA2 family monovalent cation:H+ antiporter-2